jgi:uncharacterized Zn finger protein (UPF0148 family)
MKLRHLAGSGPLPPYGAAMPIDTKCPHCRKVYRVRDEFAGKPIKCSNPTCQGAFTVPGKVAVGGPTATPGPMPKVPSATPGPMPKVPPKPGTETPPPSQALSETPANGSYPVAKKSPPRPPAEAEDIASAVFADDAAADGGGAGMVPMTCEVCEHKWQEARDKQGKNVLCPDCGRRQKVPVIKKEDWRTQDKPEGAKTEDVPDDVTTTGKSKYVTREALDEAKVFVEEYEPRPKWQYAAGAVTALGVAAAVWLALSSRTERKTIAQGMDLMAEAQKSLVAQAEPLKAEYPIFRAALDLAAAELAVNRNEPEKAAKEATARLASARTDLGTVVTSTDERDALFAALLVAQVSLGGDEDQVRDLTRLAWRTPPANQAKPRLKGVLPDVQQEMRQTLAKMRELNVKADVRLAAVRHASRELSRRGQPDLLVPVLGGNGFEPAEVPDAEAQMLLEVFRETKDAEAVHRHAEGLGLPAVRPAPPSAVALQRALDRPGFKPFPATFPDPSKNPKELIRDDARAAHVPLALTKGRADDALELAVRPGSLDSRLAALAWVAEVSPDPAKAVEAAVEVLNEPRPKSVPAPSGTLLARLAAAAGRANKPDAAAKLSAAVADAGLKEWAKAEALRQRLKATADGKPEPEASAPVPDHPKDYKVGHAWARLALARYNAFLTGDQNQAAYDGWGAFKPFGLAGMALGLRDRQLGPPR